MVSLLYFVLVLVEHLQVQGKGGGGKKTFTSHSGSSVAMRDTKSQ